MGSRILIVEDEAAVSEMTAFALRQAGFEVAEARNAAEAQTNIVDGRPDLILLDWMLPGISGLELARRWKREEMTADIPVIMLTARAEEGDKVKGLENGADDYVTKPFSPRELIARVKAVLRRSVPGQSEDTLEANGLVLEGASHRITASGVSVALGPTEYRLL